MARATVKSKSSAKSKVKIGMNLLLYTTAPDQSIFKTCEQLGAAGFQCLEWPVFAMEKKTAKQIAKFSADQGLDATTIYAIGDPKINPISADKTHQKNALAEMKKRVELAVEMGSKHLIGPFVQPLGHFTGVGPTDDEKKRCVDYLNKVGDYADQHGIDVVVEYLNRFEMYFINTAAQAVDLCKKVNHKRVKTMVDSFHANIEEDSFRQPMLTAKPYLAHIHVSEHNRGVPGRGDNIRWDDFFGGIKESGYSGYLMIEAFSAFLPDLQAAAKIWRKMFDKPEDVATNGIAFIKKMIDKHGL